MDSASDCTWWQLSLRGNSSSCRVILPLPAPSTARSVTNHIEKLIGFDRTGVVSLWPCELLLAHHFLSLGVDDLRKKPPPRRAVELAAGSNGVAALSLGKSNYGAQLEYLAVTDGNEECVAGLEETVAKSGKPASLPKMEAAFLRWSRTFEET